MRPMFTFLLILTFVLLPIAACSPDPTPSPDVGAEEMSAPEPGSAAQREANSSLSPGSRTSPGTRIDGASDPETHASKSINERPLLNAGRALSELLHPVDEHPISILIDKRARTLTVRQDGDPIKTYPVVFGFNPIDDKLRQGDGCTPEGRFKIRDLYPHRSWSRFLWIDYPTDDSWRKHRRAKAAGRIAESAGIGGEIGIHGVPEGMDQLVEREKDWTLGCISLRNADVQELYRYSKRGTEVEIVGATYTGDR